MCGRYSFNTTHAQRLRHLTELLAQRGVKVQTGEVAPGDQMAVVTGKNTHMVVTAVRWGFPGYSGGRPLINARAESVLSKPTFRDAFLNQRCVFPSDAFYEWDASHTRFSFAQPDGGLIFFGGFYSAVPRWAAWHHPDDRPQ
ncbi:SOS response-associated peptidase family protein [Lacticaseibacillus thailandensis]|uniref:SOS response-associated peptidase family protein n=1 Tax=Lacticaseibacillus thailandensis TaxID=381741 RepID=UPI0006D02D0C|nr:SOS response-associated peptidase family protein [Lacticaseibacillus thailandensis]